MANIPNPSTRVLILVQTLALLICLPALTQGAEPPVNDNFANATVLVTANEGWSILPVQGDNTFASLEPGETNNLELAAYCAPGTLWWKWTAPETGTASIRFHLTRIETLVGVFQGSAVDSLSTVVAPLPNGSQMCTDGECWYAGMTEFRARKDSTYYFAVMGYPQSPNAKGPISGEFFFRPQPHLVNDMFADRISLTGTNITVTGNNSQATTEPGEPTEGQGLFLYSMWYTWQAPAKGVLRVRVSGSFQYPYVSVYRGPAVDSLLPVAGSASDTINLYVEQGEQLHIAAQSVYWSVWGGGGGSGPYTLNVEFFVPEPTSQNDNFADAVPFPQEAYSSTGNLHGATREPGEPTGLYTDVGPYTLWWSFSPVQKGVLTVTPAAETWRPRLVAYHGTALTTLEWLVTSDGQSISIPVDPGQKYYFQLTTAFTAGGPDAFSIQSKFTPAQTNDAFENAHPLEGASVSVNAWITSPTVQSGEPLPNPQILGTLWWSWAAPAYGRVVISPGSVFQGGSAGPSQLALYTGPTLDRLEPFPARRQGNNGPFIFASLPGKIYHIQVWAALDNRYEPTSFQIEFFPFTPADNDNFADAAFVDNKIRSNLGATRELGEPEHRPGGPNKSLWWKWTAPANTANASFRTTFGLGTITNVTLALYQGASVDTLQLVAKGTNAVSFSAWATETYYLAAETEASVEGDIDLHLFPGRPSDLPYSFPGNLVKNPSFEQMIDAGTFADWSGPLGGHIQEVGADGRNFAFFGTSAIWQDLPTVPGQPYRLRFVYGNEQGYDTQFSVSLGNTTFPAFKLPPGPATWQAAEFNFVATSDISRLLFKSRDYLVNLDQVSLIWMNQPPIVISSPSDITVFEGGSAIFHAGISGADPVSRQWYFNNSPLPDANASTLRLDNVRVSDAGTYFLRATNSFGVTQTAPVTLTVETASSPQFVLHPQGDQLFPGQYFVLQSVAVGTPPLRFQWFHNDAPILGATNSTCIFPAFTSAQAGTYFVQVSNGAETTKSLSANLTVLPGLPQGGGTLWFANYYPGWREFTAPVFDTDGVTRLAGSNFVAQLYAGSSAANLRPVGDPRPFLTGFSHGLWQWAHVTLPTIPPGAPASLQVRAWDRSIGPSYEIARALGGRFGRSAVFEIVAGEPGMPAPLSDEVTRQGLLPFSLQAGLPNFVTGRLSLAQRHDDGTLTWELTGAPGFRYLVERQTDGANWLPFQILTNQAGTVIFTDTATSDAQTRFYRARMLD